jgi:hypothetical protein
MSNTQTLDAEVQTSDEAIRTWKITEVDPNDIYPHRKTAKGGETQKQPATIEIEDILKESGVVSNFSCVPQIMAYLVKGNKETGEQNSLHLAEFNGDQRILLKRQCLVKDLEGNDTLITDVRILFQEGESDDVLVQEIHNQMHPSYIAYHFVPEKPEKESYVVREDLESDVDTVASYAESQQGDKKHPSKEYALFKKEHPHITYVQATPKHYEEIEFFLTEWCDTAYQRTQAISDAQNDRNLIDRYLQSDEVIGGLIMEGDKVIGIEFHSPHPANPQEIAVGLVRKNLRTFNGIGNFLTIERAKALKAQGFKKILTGGTENETQKKFKQKFQTDGQTHQSYAYEVYNDGTFQEPQSYLRDIWSQRIPVPDTTKLAYMHDRFPYLYAKHHYEAIFEYLPNTPATKVYKGYVTQILEKANSGQMKKEDAFFFSGAAMVAAKVHAGELEDARAIGDAGWYVGDDPETAEIAQKLLPSYQEGQKLAEKTIPSKIKDLIKDLHPAWFEKIYGMPFTQENLDFILNGKPILARMDQFTEDRSFIGENMKYPEGLRRNSFSMMKAFTGPTWFLWNGPADANNYWRYASRFGEDLALEVAKETRLHEQTHLEAIDPAVQLVMKAPVMNWLSEGVASYLSKPDWYVADAIKVTEDEGTPDIDYIIDNHSHGMGRTVNGEMAYANEILLTVALAVKQLDAEKIDLLKTDINSSELDDLIKEGFVEIVKKLSVKAHQIIGSSDPDSLQVGTTQELLTVVDPSLVNDIEKEKLEGIIRQLQNAFSKFHFDEEQRRKMYRR